MSLFQPIFRDLPSENDCGISNNWPRLAHMVHYINAIELLYTLVSHICDFHDIIMSEGIVSKTSKIVEKIIF